MSVNLKHIGITYVNIFAFILILFWGSIVGFFFPDDYSNTLPSFWNMFPGVLALGILMKINSPYSRLIGYIWLAWYFIGSINVLASSVILAQYYSFLDLHDATQIFLWSCFFYFLGLLAWEYFFTEKKISPYGIETVKMNIHPLLGLFLLVFPFLWLGSMYLSLGYIPMFSGGSIVDRMYNSSYGVLYPYGACLVISILYSGYKCIIEKRKKVQFFYIIFTLFLMIISMADGKRAFAMVAMAGLLGLSFRLIRHKTWTLVLPNLSYLIIFLYVGTLLIRTGGSDREGILPLFMTIGVEFRDFVFSVNNFLPGDIDNYSWGASTFAAMTNGLVLKAFSLDKSALVSLDSAHAWAVLWGGDFGIRTGIVSELWFAYGVFAMFLLFIFGLLTGFVVKVLCKTEGIRELLFMLAIFGLILLSIMGQSTFIAGALPVLLYIYIAIRAVGSFFFKKQAIRMK